MKSLPNDLILALFLCAVSFAACGGGETNNNARTTSNAANRTGEGLTVAKTNVEELSLLVKVPYEAEDIVWKEYAAGKKVIAVLRFSPADANKVVANAEKYGGAENVNLPVETWFPGELIAQGEMSGDSALKGLGYNANDFYLAPYTIGKITRIEATDYFVLEVSAP